MKRIAKIITKRLIISVIVALALTLPTTAITSTPAYAAKGDSKTTSKTKKSSKKGGSKKGGSKKGGGSGSGSGGGSGGGGGGGGSGSGGGGSSCPGDQTAKGQVLKGLGQTGNNCSDSQVNKTIQTAVTILSLVVGIASVIVILVAGFKYIASAGDQNKVAGAKGTLIYALIGLAVAATTQLLIHFVLYNTDKT